MNGNTVRLEDSTKRLIEHSSHYIHVHQEQVLEGSEGEHMLRYAMELRKEIIVYVPTGLERHPVTRILDGYPHHVIVGDVEDAVRLVEELLGVAPGGAVHLDSQGYGAGGRG